MPFNTSADAPPDAPSETRSDSPTAVATDTEEISCCCVVPAAAAAAAAAAAPAAAAAADDISSDSSEEDEAEEVVSPLPPCREFHARYLVPEPDKPVGEGATGKVYKCVRRPQKGGDANKPEQFAVKVVDYALKPECRKEAANEIRALRAVGDHEHIVTLVDVFETEDNMFIVMEYADKGSLIDYRQFYSEHQARIVLRQLLLALQHMHDKGYVHRDVKLDNVLIWNCDHHGERAKFADFGFSVHKDESLGGVMGTWAYFSPELIKQSEEDRVKYNPPMDLWATGVVLYSMLAGKLPFQSDDTKEMFRRERLKAFRELKDKIMRGVYDLSVPGIETASDEAKDLMAGLMQWHPSRRLTAEQALNHPFFAPLDSRSDTRSDSPNTDETEEISCCSMPAAAAAADDTPSDSSDEEEDQEDVSPLPPCREFHTRYLVPKPDKPVGEGATGKVYKCVRRPQKGGTGNKQQEPEQFAVKVVDYAQKPECRQEAANEIRALRAVGDHEHIVTLVDVFETEDNMFIVMEYADKGSLIDYRQFYSEHQARILLRQLLLALQHMHDRGYVHRDVKLDNVLIWACDRHGERAKFADFGFSVHKAESLGAGYLGSTAYYSPELIKQSEEGRVKYTASMDLWATGVVMYTMLAGKLPFLQRPTTGMFWSVERQARREFKDKIMRADYDLSVPGIETASDEAKDLMAGLMQRQPSRRLTAEQALNHPFFTAHGPHPEHHYIATTRQHV